MLALLHTSPAHIPVFEALRDEDHQGLEMRHFVDEELLARARRESPEAVADGVRAALDRAVGEGARADHRWCRGGGRRLGRGAGPAQ